MKENGSKAVTIVVSVLLLSLAIYIGSYLALVQPAGILRPDGQPGSYRMEHYRFGGAVLATVFWPLEQADRKLRPRRWEEDILRFWH